MWCWLDETADKYWRSENMHTHSNVARECVCDTRWYATTTICVRHTFRRRHYIIIQSHMYLQSQIPGECARAFLRSSVCVCSVYVVCVCGVMWLCRCYDNPDFAYLLLLLCTRNVQLRWRCTHCVFVIRMRQYRTHKLVGMENGRKTITSHFLVSFIFGGFRLLWRHQLDFPSGPKLFLSLSHPFAKSV